MSDFVIIRGCRHAVEDCITCGVIFTVPESRHVHARAEGGFFQCPNGHSQGWSKDRSERESLRRERDRLKQDQARLEDEKRQAEDAASLARVRAEKAEAATKRLKKRSSAGTCPCCARTFSNMADHMKHQHPQFVAEGGTKVVPIKRRANQ
jgi:hypothetical protein